MSVLLSFLWGVADTLRDREAEYGRATLLFTVLRGPECVRQPHREVLLSEVVARISSRFGAKFTDPQIEDFVIAAAGVAEEDPRIADQIDHNAVHRFLASPQLRETLIHAVPLSESGRGKLAGAPTGESTRADEFIRVIGQYSYHSRRLLTVEAVAPDDTKPRKGRSRPMAATSAEHPAIEHLLSDARSDPHPGNERDRLAGEHTTSLSLARALAVGVLSRIDPGMPFVDVWDPATGTGFAGSLLLEALRSAGMRTRYRGQDINQDAVEESRQRFDADSDVAIALGDTLTHDAFEDFAADLVIVDAPWGMDWGSSAPAIKARQRDGAFGFGLPQRSDSTWLFISLALEKLRPADQGGGRVAALVNPGALSSGGSTAEVRRRIVDAGLLESVTRLPEGLAPNTAIPLYLLTFTSRARDVHRAKAMVADLQTMFTTERGRRSIPVEAFRELESGLRTMKPGPRNRTVSTRQFVRRDANLVRMTPEGRRLSWRVTTHGDTAIDDSFLQNRYGSGLNISVVDEPLETVDLDPSRVFGDDSRELVQDMASKGWPSQRLSSLLGREPEVVSGTAGEQADRLLFVPTTRSGRAATELYDTNAAGRVLAIHLDDNSVHPPFLAAWLNSEQGIASRLRATDAGRVKSQVVV